MKTVLTDKCIPCKGTRAYEYRHSARYELDKRKAAFAEAKLTERQYLKLDGAGLYTVEDWLWEFNKMGLIK